MKRGSYSGALWMLYSYVVGFGLQGIYFLILARVLGAENFGVFSGSLAIAAILATLAGAGAGSVMVLRTSRDPSVYRTQFGTALLYIAATFLPLALLALILGSQVSESFFWTLVPLCVSELVFVRVLDFGFQTFQAHDRLKVTAHFNVAAAALRIVLVGLFATTGMTGSAGWSFVYALGNVLLAVSISALAWRRYGGPRLEKSSLKGTWRTGVYFALGMSSRTAYTDGDKFVLNFAGMAVAAGQYSAAFKLVTMAFAPIQAIVYSSNTRLFRAGEQGYRAVWTIIRKMLPLCLGYAAIAGSLLFLAAPLLPSILGDDFSQSVIMLKVLAPLLFFQALHYIFGDALMGLGKQRQRSMAQLTVAILSIVANLVLVPHFGWPASTLIAIGSALLLAMITVTIFVRGLRRERSS